MSVSVAVLGLIASVGSASESRQAKVSSPIVCSPSDYNKVHVNSNIYQLSCEFVLFSGDPGLAVCDRLWTEPSQGKLSAKQIRAID